MTNWCDVKRSDTPLPWRKMLERLTFTHEELVQALADGKLVETIVERTREVMNNQIDPAGPQSEEDVVDMDEIVQEEAEENDLVEEVVDEVEEDDDVVEEVLDEENENDVVDEKSPE